MILSVHAHVLVAEDDEKQAELIRRSLLREGRTATVVHDGGAALEAVRRNRPDLVVLDLLLPVIDGFGVCRVLRQQGDIPVPSKCRAPPEARPRRARPGVSARPATPAEGCRSPP